MHGYFCLVDAVSFSFLAEENRGQEVSYLVYESGLVDLSSALGMEPQAGDAPKGGIGGQQGIICLADHPAGQG